MGREFKVVRTTFPAFFYHLTEFTIFLIFLFIIILFLFFLEICLCSSHHLVLDSGYVVQSARTHSHLNGVASVHSRIFSGLEDAFVVEDLFVVVGSQFHQLEVGSQLMEHLTVQGRWQEGIVGVHLGLKVQGGVYWGEFRRELLLQELILPAVITIIPELLIRLLYSLTETAALPSDSLAPVWTTLSLFLHFGQVCNR